jgi:putative radical SAM enzyme (TIGR03279 family)
VTPDGVAARAGVQPGDQLVAINGLVPRDIIDVRLDAATDRVELDLLRCDVPIVLAADKDPDEDLGIEFETPVFDAMKRCNNACEFCFIRGMPPGLRRSLYEKDDDFRYSFLYGNFTTLTNLSEAEWRRLIFQRLSPLHVSVHATDKAIRADLLSNPKAPPILPQLDELAAHGIQVHAQIVLMPGLNDGAVLEQTISDLGARYPGVASAAVVPVGLTAHSRVQRIRALTKADAVEAIATVQRFQRDFRRNSGEGFVYAADELYLLAEHKLPGPRAYDDYPQLQNGVGLIQLFREGWKRAVRGHTTAIVPPFAVCWATAPLMAPILQSCANDLADVSGLQIAVVPVENTLFGGQVSVAGLVSGEDVVRSLREARSDRVVLPRSMFDVAGQRTIDGWSPAAIEEALGVQVVVASSPRDLIQATLRPSERPAA